MSDLLPYPRRLLAGVVLVVLSAAAASSCKRGPVTPDPKAPRPHIVFIVADDLGWGDVGFTNGDARLTPNIDALAQGGVVLERLYGQALCTQTRAAFSTGRFPFRFGLQDGVILINDKHGLPLEERTVYQGLHEVGYYTALLGKWHLGHSKPEYLPQARGFDYHYGHYCAAGDFFNRTMDELHDWHRNGELVFEDGYTTQLLAQEAEQLIAKHDPARPLYLQLAFNAPHSPTQAPPSVIAPLLERYEPRRAAHLAQVVELDVAVGRVVAALERRGMRKDTLLVFTSDHGGDERIGASNDPWRGSKDVDPTYEGALRVPFVLHWPGGLEGGGRKPKVVAHMVDLYPTFLKLAGASLEQPNEIDGVDLWPYVAGGERQEIRELPLAVERHRGVVLNGDWKLVVIDRQASGAGMKGQKAKKSKDGKDGKKTKNKQKGKEAGVSEEPDQTIELYDLKADPYEEHNLARTEVDTVNQLMSHLAHYRDEAATSLRHSKGRPPEPEVWPPAAGVQGDQHHHGSAAVNP